MTDTLARWAAVVPVFVEAGCLRPAAYVEFEFGGEVGAVLGCLRNDRGQTSTINNGACIAVLEKWFREVAWRYFDTEWDIPDGSYMPRYSDHCCSEATGDPWMGYEWRVGEQTGFSHNPTESHIACAEALAEIVKGGE